MDHLIGAAEKDTRGQLRILGRRIPDVIDPDVADEYERQRLDDEDQRARRRTSFASRRNGDGTTDIRGRLSDALARRLLRYLHAFTNPRRDDTGDDTAVAMGQESGDRARRPAPGDRRPHDQRMGEALGAFLDAVDPMRLPIHGGDATTVVVTIDLETLRGQLAAAGYVGEDVSAAGARRLACHAKIVPAVHDGTPRSSTWGAPNSSTALPRGGRRPSSTRSAKPRVRRPLSVVRGPPSGPVGPGRLDRPRRPVPALLVPPPPRPRTRRRHEGRERRRRPVSPAELSGRPWSPPRVNSWRSGTSARRRAVSRPRARR